MARKRFSRAIEKAIYNKYNGLCGICARKLEFDDGEIDHITPLSKGGSNDTTNLQWSCPRCNKLKGNQLTNKQARALRKIVNLASIFFLFLLNLLHLTHLWGF